MQTVKLKKLITAALFMALTCVATLVIQIPSATNGYVNLGDCLVLLSAWLRGPVYGGIAAGVGSMLADVFTGYVIYAPGTLLIKGLMAVTAALVLRGATKASGKREFPALLVGGVLSEVIMIVGYFLYAALIFGEGLAAASGIPGNCVQAVVGLAAAILLYTVLKKAKLDRVLQ